MDVLGENEALQQFFNGKTPKQHSPVLPRTIFSCFLYLLVKP